MKPANAYLRQEMRSYLAAVPDATEQELAALNVWVRQGNSPYCNPSHIADEQGREMPFIHAMRVVQELAVESENEKNHQAQQIIPYSGSGQFPLAAALRIHRTRIQGGALTA